MLFRLRYGVLAFAIICFLSHGRTGHPGRQGRRRPGKHMDRHHSVRYMRYGRTRPKFKQVLALLRKQGTPKYHGVLLDWNLTDQLSAPRYMLNLYKNLSTADGDSMEFNVSNVTTTKGVRGADTIMGILNDDVTDNQQLTSTMVMKFKFKFTAKIKKNESVEVAEFHVYKDVPKYSWMMNDTFLIELAVVIVPGYPSPHSNVIGKRIVNGWETGWQIFDVTDTIDTWIVSPKNNYGLELSVTRIANDSPMQVDAAKLGFVGFNGPYAQRPFIVSFFKGDPTEQRRVIMHASERKRRSTFNPGTLKYGNRASTKECKKHHLYVDFHELSWKKWIIAPNGYYSSYCEGECPFGLLSSNNATNHAIVQTLVNTMHPYSAPSACCAPTKLNSISVLYYDTNKNVVLKKFKDMVVKACGCH